MQEKFFLFLTFLSGPHGKALRGGEHGLTEFAPAGAKKVRSFFPGSCASDKTPLSPPVCSLASPAAKLCMQRAVNPLASEGEAFGGRENARVRGKRLPNRGKMSTMD